MTNLLIISEVSHRLLTANSTSGVYEGGSDSDSLLVDLGVVLGLLVLLCVCCTFACCYWMDNEENKPYVVKEPDLEKGKEAPEFDLKKNSNGGNTIATKASKSPKKQKDLPDSQRPYPLSKEKTFETKPSIKMYQGSQNFDAYIQQIGSYSSDANDMPGVPVSVGTEYVQPHQDDDIQKYAERHLTPKLTHQQSYFSRYGFESMTYTETGTSFRMPGGSSWYDKPGAEGGAGGGVSGKVKMTTGNYYLRNNVSNNSNNVSLQSSSTSSVSMASSTNTMSQP